MIVLALAVFMAAAVAVLVMAERTGRRELVLVAKPAASLAFVIVGWIGLQTGRPYGAWVLLALLLCLAGDVLLMFPRSFVPGVMSFLLGHVAFIAAFWVLLPPRSWPAAWAIPPLLVSALGARWLAPHLGRLRVPVLSYIAVITVMVWGAVSVTTKGRAPWFLATGAALFYFSELAVASDRLVTKRFRSRAWGLPAYYLGQLLIALTVGR